MSGGGRRRGLGRLVVGTHSLRCPGGRRRGAASPPPAWMVSTRDGAARNAIGRRPTLRARSARHGRGGRWPGALGPTGQVADVGQWRRRWPSPWRAGDGAGENAPYDDRAGEGEALPRPARVDGINQRRSGTQYQRPAPAPAGEKRPPWAGRALAGPLRPARCRLPVSGSGEGDGLRHCGREMVRVNTHPTQATIGATCSGLGFRRSRHSPSTERRPKPCDGHPA